MPNPLVDAMMEEQTAKYYRALGKVAVEWSRFENYLGEMIRMLAGADNKFGECLTAKIDSVGKILDALSELSELRRPGISCDPSFKKRIDRIRFIASCQHQAIHDVWTFDPGVANRWPGPSGGESQQGPIQTPASNIDALALEIEGLSNEFLDFRREFLMSIGLWPGQ